MVSLGCYSLSGTLIVPRSSCDFSSQGHKSFSFYSAIPGSLKELPPKLPKSSHGKIVCTYTPSHPKTANSEMENQKPRTFLEPFSMNGGEGPYSYAQNSSYQRGAVEVAVESISKDIKEKFDIKQLPSNSLTPIRIVDFGCAAGPNTFIAVQGIVDAVTNKFETEGLDPKDIEFQVFFNDQVANDFNTLFATLPPERKYYAAAVPSTFYKFLFPKGSLHFAYSSIAVNWFSEMPVEVLDEKSPAFNKGRIHYLGASKEVVEAFSAQFARDMEFFLDARAQEFVSGGLMALAVAGIPETAIASQTSTSTEFEVLGSCLMDMAKMGLISEEKVDLFNLPLYYPTPSELKAVLEKNDDFVVEQIEILKNPREHITMPNVKARTLYLRSAFEKLMNQHFGDGVVDELFKRYAEKVAASPFFLNPANQRSTVMYALLKRKDY